jgi:hypothetical protein
MDNLNGGPSNENSPPTHSRNKYLPLVIIIAVLIAGYYVFSLFASGGEELAETFALCDKYKNLASEIRL